MVLEDLRPDDDYYSHKLETPKGDTKTVPDNIERHVFAETRGTAYCLKATASVLLCGPRVLAVRRVCPHPQ